MVNESRKKGWRRFIWLFWALIGPGVLATMANNDAGGMIAYTLTGARFGIGLFIPLAVCLTIATYTTQELSMRLGVVTQTGFTNLIRQRYGRFWLVYHVLTLCLENLLMLVTEFIGMTAGMLMLGVPLWAGLLVSLVLSLSITVLAGYWAKERMALLVGFLDFGYLVLAILTHPSLSAIGHAFAAWDVPANSSNLFWYIAAIIGNSVAPFAIFFQNNTDIDKGVIDKYIRLGRIDTVIATVVGVIGWISALLAGAALFGHIADLDAAGPAEIIRGFMSQVGPWAGVLFGFLLFADGLQATFTISFSTSYVVAEAFDWANSLNDKVRQSPRFYGVYIASVVAAALILLIPNLPLNFISIVAQVGCGLLMGPILIFLLRLTNNRQLMGKYKNSLLCNIRGWLVSAVLIGVSVLLVVNALAG